MNSELTQTKIHTRSLTQVGARPTEESKQDEWVFAL